MQANKQLGHIHPLMAGAAASVMLVSLVGTAAITGILPTSHGTNAPTTLSASTSPATTGIVAAATPTAQAPMVAPNYAEPQPVVHPHRVVHNTVAAQVQPAQYATPAPVYQQPAPAAHNSPLGIGVGAVVGGLLGNQIGGGNGRTLATIAGAVGGGYVGNEIAKQNQ